jgi:hypothetical protein
VVTGFDHHFWTQDRLMVPYYINDNQSENIGIWGSGNDGPPIRPRHCRLALPRDCEQTPPQLLYAIRLTLNAIEEHAADDPAVDSPIFDGVDSAGLRRRKDFVSLIPDGPASSYSGKGLLSPSTASLKISSVS